MTQCPRCGGQIIRTWDEYLCLQCNREFPKRVLAKELKRKPVVLSVPRVPVEVG